MSYHHEDAEPKLVSDSSYTSTLTLGNTLFNVFCDMTFLTSVLSEFSDVTKNEEKIFHNHYYNEFIILERGTAILETEEEKYTLGESDIILIPKNMLHLIRFRPGCRHLSIGFTYKELALKNKLFNSYAKFDSLFSKKLIIKDENEKFRKITSEIKRYLREPYTFSFLMIQALIQEFILKFYELGAEDDALGMSTPFIADFNFIINQRINNIQDKTKLSDIADELFISERHLSRIIKKQYGVSFMERKQQLKIESAKQLLKSSELSIEKISERVAFYDTGTFIKQFTKRVGISPAQYRDNHLAKKKADSESNS